MESSFALRVWSSVFLVIMKKRLSCKLTYILLKLYLITMHPRCCAFLLPSLCEVFLLDTKNLVCNQLFLPRYWTLSVPTILAGSCRVKLILTALSRGFEQWIFQFTGEKPSCLGQCYSHRQCRAVEPSLQAWELLLQERRCRTNSFSKRISHTWASRSVTARCHVELCMCVGGNAWLSKNRFWQSPGKTCFLWVQLHAKVQPIQQGMTEMRGWKFV